MRRHRFLPLLLIPILFAGCQAVSNQDRTVLRAHNVPGDLYDKMVYGDPLSLDDVIALSQRAVPVGLVIHYMEESDAVYILRKADVSKLRNAGVNEQLIAFMLSTAPQYGPGGPVPYARYPYPYPYNPYGYYDAYYPGPVVFVGGYGRYGGGWGHGGWGGWNNRH